MNSEPIIKEVEDTFHLSIPQTRVDVVNNIIKKNPDISSDLMRDLVLSASMGIRVPNPLNYEPEDALSHIDTILPEIWYNIKRITRKTINFEPIDIVLNQDKRTISLHVQWVHKSNVSQSTLFLNFKNFDTYGEFTKDLYDKLNKSLHTNMIPFRLIFLHYGKMARLACVPLSGARNLLEASKVVYDGLHLNVRNGSEDPETNCSLVPTLKELLDEFPHVIKPGDHKVQISADNAEQIKSEIQEIIELHPDNPEVKIEVNTDSVMRKKPDAPDIEDRESKDTIEITLTGGRPYSFILDERLLLQVPHYLNPLLTDIGTKKKFFTLRSDYDCENYAVMCCTEEDLKPFKDFGYLLEYSESWVRNKKALEAD